MKSKLTISFIASILILSVSFPSENAFAITETKITASDAAASDQFGRSVAISGDTAIVSAAGDASFSGAAYIFERDEGGADNWGEVTKITASDAAASDLFGVWVAISGDTVIVGAYLNDDNGGSSGSAYIFERDEGGVDNWGEVTKITASDESSSDLFGQSVSISDNNAIVGAHGADTLVGAAYIFERDEGGVDNWGEVTKIAASDGSFDDRFGFSVAISGNTAIVNSQLDDVLVLNDNFGSAYIFERDEGGVDNWGEVTKITASDAAEDDNFGEAVAISGNAAMVGGDQNDDDGDLSGSAYLFERDEDGDDNWGEVTKITASDAAEGDQFGNSVGISGNTAVVGGFANDDDGASSGSAYILELDLVIDGDGDGVLDGDDNCPNQPNPLQENLDGDSLGDVCDNSNVITASKTISTNHTLISSLTVPTGVLLTVPSGFLLTIPNGFALIVESGGGVLIEFGGGLFVLVN